MSIELPKQINCPACNSPQTVKVHMSVNLDRRPELKEQIMQNELMVTTCNSCQKKFRLEPEFPCHYLNKKIWIAAYPSYKREEWIELEASSLRTFDSALGQDAPAAAKEIGEGVIPRLTFGWHALREKILLADHGINDIVMEMIKMLIVRQKAPDILSAEIRLAEIEPDQLVFIAFDLDTGKPWDEMFGMPREIIAEVQSDPSSWEAVRKEIDQGIWIDILRQMS